MLVIVLEGASVSLRGEMTRWMLELKAGVFIGTVSPRVRELLWEKIIRSQIKGAFMAYRSNNEQGFTLVDYGDVGRRVRDFDGLQLLQTKIP